MANLVAIVGRPNVGKSTFFNRLIESKQAIMDNQSGVTRDRHYGMAEWLKYEFTVIDTGGYVVGSDDIFEGAIRKQVEVAIGEADVIIFMVDAMLGLHPLDNEFAKILRQTKKPVIVAANKAETVERRQQAMEFYALGFEEVFPVSAETGSGSGDILDKVVTYFEEDKEPDNSDIPRFAILGKPNVGKSSFLNLLLGEERSIVTDIAGTTRDSIDTRYTLYGNDFFLTDTAGMRKKAKVREDIEFYSVMRSLRALENSDVCIMMVDAQDGVQAQDVSLIRLADKYKKGVVLMVNKWDLVAKDGKTAQKMEEEIREKLAPMNYMPIVFTSVLTKQRIHKVVETAKMVNDNRQKKISTSRLNEVMLPEIENYPPPCLKGKFVKIKYITQLPTYTPAFAFFCNLPQYVQESYQRYLENKLRSHFDFTGVPIQVYLRKK